MSRFHCTCSGFSVRQKRIFMQVLSAESHRNGFISFEEPEKR